MSLPRLVLNGNEEEVKLQSGKYYINVRYENNHPDDKCVGLIIGEIDFNSDGHVTAQWELIGTSYWPTKNRLIQTPPGLGTRSSNPGKMAMSSVFVLIQMKIQCCSRGVTRLSRRYFVRSTPIPSVYLHIAVVVVANLHCLTRMQS